MLYPSLSELLSKINSRYLLVNIIAQRARDISAANMENGIMTDRKPVSLAIEAIVAGDVSVHIDGESSVI